MPACQSGAPIVFPPRPVQTNPTVLLGDGNSFDDVSVPIMLDFPVQLFDSTTSVLYVGVNGVRRPSQHRREGNLVDV